MPTQTWPQAPLARVATRSKEQTLTGLFVGGLGVYSASAGHIWVYVPTRNTSGTQDPAKLALPGLEWPDRRFEASNMAWV